MAGLGVCIDLCCCWSEAGLRATIERAIPRCGIVQVSDYVYGDRAMPCRAVPGDGAIPIRTMLEWMLGAGYEGAFDLELLGPRIEREGRVAAVRSEEHTSELQSLMRISYAVFCLKKKKKNTPHTYSEQCLSN